MVKYYQQKHYGIDGGNLMAYISAVDKGQMVLFPESLDEFIDEK